MNEIPVLRGYVDGKELYVHCPYCDRTHVHGATEDVLRGVKSHRGAHCSSSANPFRDSGYYVAIWEEVKKK